MGALKARQEIGIEQKHPNGPRATGLAAEITGREYEMIVQCRDHEEQKDDSSTNRVSQ
jgi:hypothetical protein